MIFLPPAAHPYSFDNCLEHYGSRLSDFGGSLRSLRPACAYTLEPKRQILLGMETLLHRFDKIMVPVPNRNRNCDLVS